MSLWLRFIAVASLLLPAMASGEMTSTNYYIYADSIGLNGGDISTSTTYTLNDTANDSPGGQSTSTLYRINGGFQGMDLDESLTLTISDTNLAFGTISASAVAMNSVTTTVSCNSITGYSLAISNVSGTTPTAVADGSVTAGVEEYGVAVTGDQAAFVDDRSVIGGRQIAFSDSAILSSVTVVSFKAAAASPSGSGSSYAHTVTITASANF